MGDGRTPSRGWRRRQRSTELVQTARHRLAGPGWQPPPGGVGAGPMSCSTRTGGLPAGWDRGWHRIHLATLSSYAVVRVVPLWRNDCSCRWTLDHGMAGDISHLI
jgi:hypothetical protein